VSNAGDVAPGTVLVIDPDNPGKLTVSSRAYDRGVAGVVAGANGLDRVSDSGRAGSITTSPLRGGSTATLTRSTMRSSPGSVDDLADARIRDGGQRPHKGAGLYPRQGDAADGKGDKRADTGPGHAAVRRTAGRTHEA